jgi:hydroxymethylpyrimidine/phosphomethylpyrimidine kinase
MSVMESIASAKEFITKAIKRATPVGKGRVPLL